MQAFFDYVDNFLATATPMENTIMVIGGLVVLCGLVSWAADAVKGRRE